MDNLSRLIEESIELELNVAGLYALFHTSVHEDADFWWRLHQEERNHASLLSALNKTFLPADAYPESLILPRLETLHAVNARLRNLLEKFRGSPPHREEAFRIALEIENSAGELHFQKFIEHKGESQVDKVFKNLIGDDKDHIQRIMKYMKEKGIEKQEK